MVKLINHNMNRTFQIWWNRSDVCLQVAVEGQTTRFFLQYFYPLLLVVSILGNSVCIAVYRHKYLCSSPTVRLLTAKAIANIGFCASLIPNIIFTVLREYKSAATADDNLAYFYWHFLKYVLALSNTLATFAIWITVFVMLDHYLLVRWPMKAQLWSSLKSANIVIVVLLPVAILLHVHLIVNRDVNEHAPNAWSVCPNNTVLYEFVNSANVDGWRWCEKMYYSSTALLHTVIPLVLLVWLTWQLWDRLINNNQLSEHNNDRKQTVIRLALANTLCHFVLESLDGINHITSFIFNSTLRHDLFSEPVLAVGNLLTVVNASSPFLVFLCCSPRFRHITKITFCKCESTSNNGLPLESLKENAPLTSGSNGKNNRYNKEVLSPLTYDYRDREATPVTYS